uniref:Uncharacterized protein n=1 Tax=Tanacetum cinerariifolium TaxID=118510 RepID=A0A699K4M0_TANCI|nr:hypothetical protein [Tanacetum cinerariifolium]
MNEVYDYGQNSCYDSTSIGFDQSQPQQYTVNHPIFNAHNSYLDSQIQLNNTLAKIKDQMTSVTGDDEVELTDEESSDSDDEEDVAGIFRIETNVCDFETPLCRTFKEFNYLLQIDPDVLTKDTEGFKTYEEYKDD